MQLELTSDVILKGPIWSESIDQLKGKFFDTIWDIYALSISIGMMFDCQIDSDDMVPEGYDQEPRYIPRNLLGHAQNESLLEFMFQTALVTTKWLDLDEDQRLELAFSEDKKPDFNPVAFLTKYANYGITKIHELISDSDDIETMESLMTFLNSAYESGIDNLANNEELEDY